MMIGIRRDGTSRRARGEGARAGVAVEAEVAGAAEVEAGADREVETGETVEGESRTRKTVGRYGMAALFPLPGSDPSTTTMTAPLASLCRRDQEVFPQTLAGILRDQQRLVVQTTEVPQQVLQTTLVRLHPTSDLRTKPSQDLETGSTLSPRQTRSFPESSSGGGVPQPRNTPRTQTSP